MTNQKHQVTSVMRRQQRVPFRRGQWKFGKSRQSGVFWFVILFCSSVHAETITTETLLREMVSRESLARFPNPAYVARQVSSYDRASKKPGTEDWTANRDFSQFLRTEQHQGRRERVMLDVEGPGAIVRIWITWAGRPSKPFSNGAIRLYLDGQSEPIVEKPASEFIDGGPTGERNVWNDPSLAYGVSLDTPHDRRGHNLFVPIPYAKSCRITYETDQTVREDGRIDESFYYHIGYRSYPSETSVETFSLQTWNALRLARETVQTKLYGSRESTESIPERTESWSSSSVTISGPAAVDSFTVDASRLSAQQLRSTIVSLTFDGTETVRVPLDGFFTSGYVPEDFQTWMHSYRDGIMRCRYVMPFKETFVAKLVSADGTEVDAPFSITTKPWSWDDRSMHFHADWRVDQNLRTGVAKTQDNREGVVDLGFLDAQGQGVMVGDSIMLFSGAARWWGEGDEKISVDGEAFPSHFGTGTEDYYGYAWCRPEAFSKPFHAQPVGRGALLGGPVVNTRIRSLDAIPFHRSIDFDMELWHWADATIDYARTVFWYGRPGAISSGSTPEKAVGRVALRDTDLTPATNIPNAIEGESAKIVSVTGGEVVIDRYTLFGWSGGAQLLWKDARPGDELVLAFEQLPRNPELLYTVGPDYGRASVTSGGSEADLRGRFFGVLSVLETRRVPLFDFDSKARQVRIRMLGNGNEPRRFGLDAIVSQESSAP